MGKMYCASCHKAFDFNHKFCEFCGTKNPYYGMRCSICNKEINFLNSRIGLGKCHSCLRKEALGSTNLGEEYGIKESYGERYKYTWRSVEGFEGLEFSKDIKEILKKSLHNDNQISVNNITDELISSGICNNSGNLTKNGKVFVLSLLPLEEQCNILNISLKRNYIPKITNPEIDTLNYFKKNGVIGCYSEGGIIQILLYSICFHKLFPLHQKKYATDNDTIEIYHNDEQISSAISYSTQFMGFLDYFIDFEDELIDTIKNSNKNQVAKNYDKILSFQIGKSWSFLYNKASEITKDVVLSFYLKLGISRIVEIAKLFFTDPYAYISGWPDLTIIEKDEVKFIEVKKGDNLKRSQIITIGDLIKSTSLDISVLKIV